MVDFGGWDMPIQYKTGIRAEHLAVRSGVGVFDLSHMGRLYVRGADALRLVQWLATNDAGRLAAGRAQYSLICGERGQILDDIIVYNLGRSIPAGGERLQPREDPGLDRRAAAPGRSRARTPPSTTPRSRRP